MTIYSINNKKYSAQVPTRRRASVFSSKNRSTAERIHSQRGSSTGIFLAGLGTLSIICIAGFMYIFQITTSAVNGYDTSSLEKQISSLQDERRGLEMQVAELQSLKTIEDGAKRLNLVVSDKVEYTSPISAGSTIAYSSVAGGI